jgi:N6-adenosine-specific RNA methylase IME4
MTKYKVLVADCPWKFGDPLPGNGRGAEKNYRCLTVKEICNYGPPEMAPDSYLFLWRVSSMVEEAYQVVRAWGFVPKTEIVWRKVRESGKLHFGMGRTLRAAHETCIVATRGKPKPKNLSTRSIFDRHSAKPEIFCDLVEALCEGPYVELFARRQRPGWTCFGDES